MGAVPFSRGRTVTTPAYLDGLKLLGRRELSVQQLRDRLLDRDHSRDEVQAAIEQLLETGALDDGRVARAHARTAAGVKGRGRLRVMRELLAIGIANDVAAAAVADVFGELDERALIARALQKKLRGRPHVAEPAEHVRLYQYLLRQGFTPAGVVAALRKLGRKDPDIG
jgi:regulatory protein